MDAVILVGGGGTRLRPLTYAVPKPLIPIINQPLICHLIENLRRNGVDHVVLAAAAGDRRLEDTLGDGAGLGVRVSYCYESEPLGSGLAVKQAARGFDRAFFVCNGDVITNLDLRAMAERHARTGATMSIFLAPVADPSSFGIAEIDAESRITRFVEKPRRGQEPSNLANAGTWLFEPEVLDHIPEEKMDGSIERLLIPALIADGRLVCGFVSDAYWMDVGTSERYMQIHRDLLQGRMESGLPASLSRQACLGENCSIHPEAYLGPEVLLGNWCTVSLGAQLIGPSAIGDNCRIGEGARVARSVVWAKATIGSGASVRDSIIGAGCVIGERASVESSVLASGARVLPGARLVGARLEPEEVAS